MSVQLAELEREAGTKLLRRVGRNVELTPAGRRLAAHAEDALAADEAIRAELAGLSDAPARVGPHHHRADAGAGAPARGPRPARGRVVGIEYEPVPVARHRDVDRQDLLREDVLLALHGDHPAVPRRGRVRLAACESDVWAAGHPGTGLDAVVRNVCNRLAGFEPDVRHRSDDALVLSALVASGRAVTLLPALLATAMPQITARRLREEHLQRTMFTATRTSARDAPAIVAVRTALTETVARIAAQRRDVAVAP